VRAQLGRGRAEEVGDGAVAGVGRGRRVERAFEEPAARGFEARLVEAEELRAEGGGELEAVAEQAQLILNEEGVAALGGAGAGVERGVAEEEAVEEVLALELVD
jgi:hypothetical protein